MRELSLQELEAVSAADGGVDTNVLGGAMGLGGGAGMAVGAAIGLSNPLGWGLLAFGAIWTVSGAYIMGQGAFG